MDDGWLRENGRRKADQCKLVYPQLKENQTTKLVMAERDKAVQERELAIAEKKTAIVERDMAYLQRDNAVAERNSAIVERDNAIAALKYAHENMDCSCIHRYTSCGFKRAYHHQLQRSQHIQSPQQQFQNVSCNQTAHSQGEPSPTMTGSENEQKNRKVKRSRKEAGTEEKSLKESLKPTRKSKRIEVENLSKQVTVAGERGDDRKGGVVEDLNGKLSLTKYRERKSEVLGLNQVVFDESSMPIPVCSCTGKCQQCYKWGDGGWQSACCTTTLSMHPLPLLPNKRHARVGGRKMSGSAFQKLLTRLSAEGFDLSMPVDLKDHWAKHGTNRYITIK